jgi:hypothetical protein
MIIFNDFIREQNLTELPLKGRQFTWSNMQDNPLLEQLDWFFTSLHWTTTYPATEVLPKGKPTSGHISCVISIQTSIPSSKIFRFENYWVAHPGFMQTVADSWNSQTHKENPVANLNAKFKRLRYDLKFWSKLISKLKICIENTNTAISQLDAIEDARGLTVPETNFRIILKKHLIRLLNYQQ